jgi:hypothetical protein
MKQKDLHDKQQEELNKQNISSVRNDRKTESVNQISRTDSQDRRDVANEERIKEKSKGRP